MDPFLRSDMETIFVLNIILYAPLWSLVKPNNALWYTTCKIWVMCKIDNGKIIKCAFYHKLLVTNIILHTIFLSTFGNRVFYKIIPLFQFLNNYDVGFIKMVQLLVDMLIQPQW